MTSKQNVRETHDREEPVAASLIADEIRAALSAADDADATPAERAEMLMEIAMGLQQQPN